MDMAAQQSDYLLELVKSIQGSVARLERKQDKVTGVLADHGAVLEAVEEQTKKTNGRVTKLEDQMNGTPKPKDLPPWYKDPKNAQVFIYLSLALLVLATWISGVDITELLP